MSVRFVVYDNRSGAILRCGVCAARDITLQPQVTTEEVAEAAPGAVINPDWHRVNPQSRFLEEDPAAQKRAADRVAALAAAAKAQLEGREVLRARLNDGKVQQQALEHLLDRGLLDGLVLPASGASGKSTA